jgi:EH_Signature domain
MKILEALGELSATIRYLGAQPLARRLDPALELRRLRQAAEALKAAVQIDKEPNKIEVNELATRCRLANFDLDGFSRRELRLLAWHDGLLMNPHFRQNLLTLAQSGQVRLNLSVLAKVYFGAWGHHQSPTDFESLLHWVAERQPGYSPVYQLYKDHAAKIFSSRADDFLVNEMFSSDKTVTEVLKQWDVPGKSGLADGIIQAYLDQALALIEEGRSADIKGIERTLQLPGVSLEMLRKAAERLILCRQADRVEEFRREVEMFVLDHPQLGDPRYQNNAPHWSGIERKAEQTFRGWRNKVDLVFFFNSVMKDQADKQGRKLFWLRYVSLAHESFVALCPTDAYRLRASLWREKIQYRKIVDDLEVSCFVMRFRAQSGEDMVIAEFSNVGKLRIFRHKSFLQKIGSMDRQEFGLKDLRNDQGAIESISHMIGWQSKTRNALAGYGIRPI